MSEMYEQMTLWGEILPFFTIKNKLRVIELFGGVGSQISAVEQLFNKDTSKYEHWKLCEWAYNSYCAYNSLHVKDFKDYSENKTKEELIERIYGTSTDYENPLTEQQLSKKPIEWLRNAYNNCIATSNLINIMNVKGKDLEINDTDNYTYLFTYSFPCQDLSNAGKSAGCDKGSGTRSGLLWEVERILEELKEQSLEEQKNHLPQILLLENVDMLLSKNHIHNFKLWIKRLEELGYSSYTEVLNGVDYGIPQTRKRVFCVSILGKYAYDFPRKIRLKHKLEDFLEKEVEKKYYLSEEQIKRIANWKAQQKPLESINKHIETCPTITARGAGENHSGMILIDESLFKNNEIVDFFSSDDFLRVHNEKECPTLTKKSKFGVVQISENNVNAIPIKNATEKGYLLAEEGDGIDISGRMESHRGTVQKGKAQTLTKKGGEDVGVCVEENSLFTEAELALITPDLNIRRYIGSDQIDNFKEGQCATTTFPNGYGHGPRTHDSLITLNKVDKPLIKQNLQIRKLTPRECWKLMGFTNTNFNDLSRNNFSNAELYSMAGDSIIVCCLIALLSPLVYDRDKHEQIINKYVEKILQGE